MAIHEHPEMKPKLQADENNFSKLFAQEVRRFYPFAPAMAAKANRDLSGTAIM
nr:hypothetical protein [Planococcus salinarum]